MSTHLHCIAKKHDGYWSARCLDFSLYAVGETLEEAKEKLSLEVDEYLFEALEGEDKNFAPYLLLRKAPTTEWVIFYIVSFVQKCKSLKKWLGEAFSPTLPNGPYRHA